MFCLNISDDTNLIETTIIRLKLINYPKGPDHLTTVAGGGRLCRAVAWGFRLVDKNFVNRTKISPGGHFP